MHTRNEMALATMAAIGLGAAILLSQIVRRHRKSQLLLGEPSPSHVACSCAPSHAMGVESAESSPQNGSRVYACFSIGYGTQATLTAHLCQRLPRDFPSRAFCKAMLKRGQVLVDGVVIRKDDDQPLRIGQRVEYLLPEKAKAHSARTGAPPSLELKWAYVDEHLAVCVKPQGVAVQGDPTAATLRYAVAYALPPSNGRPDALASPQHCHRIDKMTGGLLVFSLTRSASALIGLAFAQHDDEHESSNGERAGEVEDGSERRARRGAAEAADGVGEGGAVVACSGDDPTAPGATNAGESLRKTYLAIVVGKLEGSGIIDAPIHGKPARSRWCSLSCVRSASSGWISTVRLHPETGRRHQLRRHLAEQLGCPILGDPKYMTADSRGVELEGALHLWALEIELPHPATGKRLRVTTDEPPHFEQTRRREEAAAAATTVAEWETAALRAEERQQRAAAGQLSVE